MGKFLLLPVLLLIIIFVGVTVIFRFLRKLFSPFTPKKDAKFGTKSPDKTAEVLYKKDNIVVLKGEASNKSNKEN